VIHDFLYEDIVASPMTYNSKRTKLDMIYYIGDEKIFAQRQQMEIDLIMEYLNKVTVFEGKNGLPENFAVYQLFHPFKYIYYLRKKYKLPIQEITSCYVLKYKIQNTTHIRLFNYTFEDEKNMNSIRLLKKREYKLIKR